MFACIGAQLSHDLHTDLNQKRHNYRDRVFELNKRKEKKGEGRKEGQEEGRMEGRIERWEKEVKIFV